MNVITPNDVALARERIAGHVRRTPLERSTTLSNRLGANVFVKYEMFQRTGSFKSRGAFNDILSLTDEQRDRGIVGFSGGNFAQGMAYAGTQLDVDTLVVMAATTPANYIEATRAYGATVELVADVSTAMAVAEHRAHEGRTLLHPFDRPAMMAGNGTVGLEIVEDVPDLTHLFVSVGGGGLLVGTATAVLGAKPDVEIVAVETEGSDALAQSLAAGESVSIQPSSIAKTLGSPYAAAAAIELAETRLADVVVVSDAEAYGALTFIAERLKVLPELSASCTLAAADQWAHRFSPSDNVVLLLCGGNVSIADIASWHATLGPHRAD
jgi:threonine dehydratase